MFRMERTKIAVVGATGMVGQIMLKVLEERNFPVKEIIPVASEKSVGKKISFKGKEYSVVSMQDAINMKPEIALFSAGGATSLEFAPKFAEAGTTVIDNSSAWRMDVTKKLVVPEINAAISPIVLISGSLAAYEGIRYLAKLKPQSLGKAIHQNMFDYSNSYTVEIPHECQHRATQE